MKCLIGRRKTEGSVLLLVAAALLMTSAPHADDSARFSLGVLRRDGLLLPFASYDGSWSVEWPYSLVNIPISIDDVPKKWWGAAGPAPRWTAWLPDNVQRPLKLRKLRSTSVFCDMRLAIQTDYMGASFDLREPTVPKEGVAYQDLYDYHYITEQKPAILRRMREIMGQ